MSAFVCPLCASARDEARAEYQATYAVNMPRIAARNYREGWLAAQAAPAGMGPPAWCMVTPPPRGSASADTTADDGER